MALPLGVENEVFIAGFVLKVISQQIRTVTRKPREKLVAFSFYAPFAWLSIFIVSCSPVETHWQHVWQHVGNTEPKQFCSNSIFGQRAKEGPRAGNKQRLFFPFWLRVTGLRRVLFGWTNKFLGVVVA